MTYYILHIIYYIISFSYFLLICWYIYGWLRLKRFTEIKNSFVTKVSIIIPARNEESNIENCLQNVFEQGFPKELMEVIVVDDHSTDKTLEKITNYKLQITNLKVIRLNENKTGKKAAITSAIAEANGELIITTDADCIMGDKWIGTIVSYYEKYRPKMIAGPVCFHKEKNIFEKFQTLEFLSLIGISAAAINNKKPIMCNGANLTYQKNIFYDVGGFQSVNEVASGDDVFLMLKIAKDYPNGIHFLKSLDATVYTTAKKTIAEFIQQRKRWASKTSKYQDWSIRAIALIVYMFNVSILAGFILSFYYPYLLAVFLFQFIFKIIIEGVFLSFVVSFFNRKDLLSLFLPLQFFYSVYVVVIATISPFGKYQWKKRSVK